MKIEYVAISRLADKLTEKFFYVTEFENNSGIVTGKVVLLSTQHEPLQWVKAEMTLPYKEFNEFYREEKGEVELV